MKKILFASLITILLFSSCKQRTLVDIYKFENENFLLIYIKRSVKPIHRLSVDGM